jgi:hypothetical protein
MTKRWLLPVGLLVALVVAPAARPRVADEKQDRDALMREKLELAQKVFAALSKNELAGAATDAASLAALTRDARWRIRETPEYLSRSVEFERAATTLSSMAAGKNVEGAALAWVQLSTQCFDCHRWLRQSKHSDER